MSTDARIEALLEQILNSEQTPEQVCAEHPELLEQVRLRWRRLRQVESELNAIFPPSEPGTGQWPPTASMELPNIPGYAVEGVLGRGGMGVVYKARHLKLGRTVAVKMLLAGPYAGAHELARFTRESEAIAALRHENIVQVYGVGDLEGRPYFTMEFIEGGTLAQHLDGAPQSAQHAAVLMIPMARAVQVAHLRGIVHRDLKPGNVLLTADGTPKITDFGVARWFDGDSSLTASDGRVGTPSYMAPEQATGSWGGVTAASDIYSMGAILYEMLTGRPPFHGATAVETLWQAAHHDPVAPTRLVPRVPRDIETICLKCLAKDPGKRYANAGQFADDLERFLRNEPVLARPVGMVGYVHRWVLRHQSLAAALAGLVLLLITLVLVSLFAAAHFHQLEEAQRLIAVDKSRLAREKEVETQKARIAEGQEITLRRIADEQSEAMRRHLYVAQMNLLVQAAQAPSGVGQVKDRLATWENSKPDLRNWEWYRLNALCHREVMTLAGHVGSVAHLAWRPDGRLLASSGTDSTLRLWDPSTGEETPGSPYFPEETSYWLAWSPDGNLLATAGWFGTVKLWGAASHTAQLVYGGHHDSVLSVAWSPDGSRLASCSIDRTIQIWDSTSGKVIHVLRGSEDEVACVAWSVDGKRVASGCRDASVRVCDAMSGLELMTLKGHQNWVNDVAWSPDGRWLASGSNDQTLKIWNASDGTERRTLSGHALGVRAIAWNRDSSRIASGSDDQTVKIWSADDGREIVTLRGHSGPVASVVWSPDGTRVASASADSTIKIWDAETGPEVGVIEAHTSQVDSLAWRGDGARIVTASADGTARVWDVQTGDELLKLRHDEGRVCQAAWSPDGTRVATAGADKSLRIWDAITGAQLRSLRGHGGEIFSLAWSPDGRRLASGSLDKTVRIWDAGTGQQLHVCSGHNLAVYSVVWSPDGTRLASGSDDFTCRIWNATTGVELQTLRSHRSDVNGVAWSPDGRWIACASADELISIWEAASGRMVKNLRGHTSRVNGVSWSPDGARLASVSDDHTTKIWDLASGEQVSTFEESTALLRAVAWRPDGFALASVGNDKVIRIYDATAGYRAARSNRYLPVVDRSIQAAPKDASIWRLRAQIDACSGDWAAATDDVAHFMKAPGPRFFTAGCWIIGPYTEDWNIRCLPEADPDPGHRVPLAPGDSSPGPSWESVSVNARGFVNFGARYGNASHISAYAMYRVYAAKQGPAAVLVGSDDAVRVWANGELIHERLGERSAKPDEDAAPAILQAGWNTILARVVNATGDHALYLRVSDDPADLRRLPAAGAASPADHPQHH